MMGKVKYVTPASFLAARALYLFDQAARKERAVPVILFPKPKPKEK